LLLAALAAWLLVRTTRYAEKTADRTAQLERSEERIRNILAQAPDAFIGIDPLGRITEWNQQAEATFGWGRAGVIGRTLAEVIIPPRMRAWHDAGLRDFAHTGTGPFVNSRVELPALHRDGHEIPVEVSIGALRTPDGFVANAFLHDISERTQAQAELVASNKRLRDITDNLPLLISYIDQDQTLRFCNEAWRTWLGVDPASIVGQPIADVLGPELYEQRRAHLQRALTGERVSFDLISTRLGVSRHLHTLFIPDVRADGAVAGIYSVVTDVTTYKELELRLDRLANADSLTDLPNRRRFEERLPEALARGQRDHRPMALMFLDVDRFKQVNDSHGHATGDAVLKQFALRLGNCVRVTDTVARLAGDEFVIILEGLNACEDAELAARKIGAALQPPFVVEGLSLSVTASIGVAFVDAETVSPTDVIAIADAAVYQAKRDGRNTFVLFRMPGTEKGLALPAA
jgi:diguanylate cyclase (GGDEF)-like protein/PAS domain S-box-containing protein